MYVHTHTVSGYLSLSVQTDSSRSERRAADKPDGGIWKKYTGPRVFLFLAFERVLAGDYNGRVSLSLDMVYILLREIGADFDLTVNGIRVGINQPPSPPTPPSVSPRFRGNND